MLEEVRLVRGRSLTAKQVIQGLWPIPPVVLDMACLSGPMLGQSFGHAFRGGGSLL